MEEMSMQVPYYVLKIFINRKICSNSKIIEKYREKIAAVQKKMESYKNGEDLYMDAGFDLFIPYSIIINHNSCGIPVDHGINCAMTFNEIPTAFYLYPRSSTGSKTSLRLSNSVGIIDSGYRGNIVALFDNINWFDTNITCGDRLVQICAPNIMYPIYPVLVDRIEELGITSRGSKGFGSTGR